MSETYRKIYGKDSSRNWTSSKREMKRIMCCGSREIMWESRNAQEWKYVETPRAELGRNGNYTVRKQRKCFQKVGGTKTEKDIHVIHRNYGIKKIYQKSCEFCSLCFAVLIKWHFVHCPRSQDQKQESPSSPPFITSSSSYRINYHIRLFLPPKYLLSRSSSLNYTALQFGPGLPLTQIIKMSTCFEPISPTAARASFLKLSLIRERSYRN